MNHLLTPSSSITTLPVTTLPVHPPLSHAASTEASNALSPTGSPTWNR